MFFLICQFFPGNSSAQEIVVSSYYNPTTPFDNRDEWTELLVLSDNLSIQSWSFRDNNGSQTSWQQEITFNNNAFWSNLRAGTIIIIWHRPVSSSLVPHPTDVGKSDGYIELSADNTTYFSSGDFGTSPSWSGSSLNISNSGDMIEIRDASDAHIHSLGHMPTPGSDYTAMPPPKLNHTQTVGASPNSEAVFVFPGNSVADFGTPAQSGTAFTQKSITDLTFGLPNNSSSNLNSDFWRTTRQPGWINPALTAIANATNDHVNLNWNTCIDLVANDGTQGYLILRNTSNSFSDPQDGTTYTVGATIGTSTVVSVIPTSSLTAFSDPVSVNCGDTFYYRVYAFRYGNDDTYDNNYHVARGCTYNEINFASDSATGTGLPSAPVIVSQNINGTNQDVCLGYQYAYTIDPINPTSDYNWSLTGGGTISDPGNDTININWLSAGTYVLSVTETTFDGCTGPAGILNITVNTTSVAGVSFVTGQNPACSGQQVTYTATPVNGGITPEYTWFVNHIPVANSDTSVFTYASLNSYSIFVSLNSSSPCAFPDPAYSDTIAVSILPALVPAITILPDQNPVCDGTAITFTSTCFNEGNSPVYTWKTNGQVTGSNSPEFTSVLNINDVVSCVLLSSEMCANPDTAVSNPVTVLIKATPSISGTTYTDPSTCGGSDGTISLHGLIAETYYFVNYNYNGTPASKYLKANSTGILIISGLPAGNYSALTVGYNGCTSEPVSVDLSDPGATSAPSVLIDSFSICPGETVELSVSGCSGNIQWSNGANGTNIEVSPDVTTYYSATCELNGCTSAASDPIEVVVKPVPQITLNTVTDPSTWCVNDGIIVLGGLIPNTVYLLNYTVEGIDFSGSQASTAAGLLEITGCKPAIYININTIYDGCVSDSIDVLVGNPISPQPPVIIVSDDTVCSGQTIQLTASGCNGVVTWSDGSTGNTLSVNITANTTFTATCTENNCTSGQGNTVTIVIAPVGIAEIVGNQNACLHDELLLTAIGNAVSYNWIQPDGVVSIHQVFSKMPALLSDSGYYKLVTTDAQGCTDTDSILIKVVLPSVISIQSDRNFCAGTQQNLQAGEGYSSYLWNDGSMLPSLSVIDEGVYWVQITDANGCKTSDSATLIVCREDIFVPNAFTPDRNGSNELFGPIAGGIILTEYTMIIFNRWGQQVFETKDYYTGWDGKLKGNDAPEGIYTYLIVYKRLDPANQINYPINKLRGTVMLLR